MYNKFSLYFANYNLLRPKQFGFHNNHSAKHDTTNLIEAIQNYQITFFWYVVLFFYLQKAFYTADHQLLLDKLSHYNIGRKENLRF